MQEIGHQVEAAWQDFEELVDKIEAEILEATAEKDPTDHPAILHDMGAMALQYLGHRFDGDGELRGYLHTRRTILLEKLTALLQGRDFSKDYPEYTDRFIITQGGREADYIVGSVAETGEPIALKLLKSDADPDLKLFFLNEQQVLSDLRDYYGSNYPPNLIELYVATDELTVTKRVIGGESVYNAIREPVGEDPKRELKKRLGYFRDIVTGLEALYQAGYEYHGDVKFPNSILGEDGVVRVSDLSGASREPTHYGAQLLCTPKYVAPEKVLIFTVDKKLAPIDRRSDVFSLGIMLYELLTLGKDPFDRNAISKAEKGNYEYSIAAAFAGLILEQKIEFYNSTGEVFTQNKLKELRQKHGHKKLIFHGCPFIGDQKLLDKLDEVIKKAIAPIVTDRYASPAEFLAALEAALGMKL